MRTITETRTIAKYEELTEEQKVKVCEHYSDMNTDYDWYDSTYEDTKIILGLLGFSNIEIQFSGFWSQGDGASFTATFSVPQTKKELKERIKAFKEYAPKDDLHQFEKLTFDKEECSIGFFEVFRIDSRYSHSCTISSDHEGLKEFARSFSNDIYKSLEREYEYLQSREAVEESLTCNDYEFDTHTLRIE